MNLSDPASLMSGLLISTVGTGFFIYGKKAGNFRALLGGIALCVIPMVVTAVWAEWAAAAACIGGVAVLGKFE